MRSTLLAAHVLLCAPLRGVLETERKESSDPLFAGGARRDAWRRGRAAGGSRCANRRAGLNLCAGRAGDGHSPGGAGDLRGPGGDGGRRGGGDATGAPAPATEILLRAHLCARSDARESALRLAWKPGPKPSSATHTHTPRVYDDSEAKGGRIDDGPQRMVMGVLTCAAAADALSAVVASADATSGGRSTALTSRD